jgi:hypothetical protein
MTKQNKEQVMLKINKGQVKMRSYLSVWAEKLGIGSTALLVTLMLAFLTGGIFYWVKINQDIFTVNYGPYGWRMFVESFPYLLVMGFVLLFVALSWLLKRYDFSYKRPLIAVFAVLLAILALLGYMMVNESNVNAYYKKGIPFGQGRGGVMRGQSFVVGEVVETKAGDIHVETVDGKNYEVKTDKSTKFPRGMVNEGDMVRVVGEVRNGQIEAYAVGNLIRNRNRHRRLEKKQIMEKYENTTSNGLEVEEEKSEYINIDTSNPVYQNTESVTDTLIKSDSANNSDIFQEKEGPGYMNSDKEKEITPGKNK